MHKITITFYSDEPIETIENVMCDIYNSDNIVALLPCSEINNDPMTQVNYNTEKINVCQCGSCEHVFIRKNEGNCPNCGSGNWVFGHIDGD